MEDALGCAADIPAAFAAPSAAMAAPSAAASAAPPAADIASPAVADPLRAAGRHAEKNIKRGHVQTQDRAAANRWRKDPNQPPLHQPNLHRQPYATLPPTLQAIAFATDVRSFRCNK